MDADFSIELGHDDPVLDFPWTDPEGRFAYHDVKRHPELLARVPEANQFSELGDFLRVVNSPRSMVESVKCDAWTTDDLSPEEEIYGASLKFASYMDLVFTRSDHRVSFAAHERFAKKLVQLLRQAPETASSAEVCVRRAYLAGELETTEGCYFTVYVNGYGNGSESARLQWEIGLKLVANAVLQLSVEELL
ncbi:MAG TPA: hypothetical protein VNW47_04070 [Terriglobales bacterium]|jgi:hypothetical protein|nr:hypothetical protein [Terriglobales bacterium]